MLRYKIITLLLLIVLSLTSCSTEKTYPTSNTFEPSPFDNPSQTSKSEETLIELRKPSYQSPVPETTKRLEREEGSSHLAVSATVTRVIDGDTVDVRLSDGSTDRVRLLGVDTPEIQSTNKPGEYGGITNELCLRQWGIAAKNYANDLLTGESVNLVLDPIAGDRGNYGRLLAYIEISEYDFNQLLIEQGFARATPEWPSTRINNYTNVQQTSLATNTGLWSCNVQNSHPKISLSDHPIGASALCKDDTYSYSQNRTGTCSHHGGVKEWLGLK